MGTTLPVASDAAEVAETTVAPLACVDGPEGRWIDPLVAPEQIPDA